MSNENKPLFEIFEPKGPVEIGRKARHSEYDKALVDFVASGKEREYFKYNGKLAKLSGVSNSLRKIIVKGNMKVQIDVGKTANDEQQFLVFSKVQFLEHKKKGSK